MKGNIHKIVVNRICTRLQWRRIVQRAFCKHDEIASPDEFTSPYVTYLTEYHGLQCYRPYSDPKMLQVSFRHKKHNFIN